MNDVSDSLLPYRSAGIGDDSVLARHKRLPHHHFRMTEDPISLHIIAASAPAGQKHGGHNAAPTCFDRQELHPILTIYGHMVAAGAWRDYALDFLPEVAVFSVFRRASEMALFRIEKRPKLKNRQGQYAVIAMGGLVMKRGHDLVQVLRVFDKVLVKARA